MGRQGHKLLFQGLTGLGLPAPGAAQVTVEITTAQQMEKCVRTGESRDLASPNAFAHQSGNEVQRDHHEALAQRRAQDLEKDIKMERR